MLKVVDDEGLIRKYAKLFTKSFKPFMDETIKARLGHQGASIPAKVSWSKKLGIWSFSKTVADVRYGNQFGVGKPPAGSHLPITAEINIPWRGIDRKTGAAFANDAVNNIYVIHRGKIGGGKKGIGKTLFEDNYRGVWAWMEDGDSLTQVAVIGALHSSRFAMQAAQFVKKIERLKLKASLSSQTLLNFAEASFHEEFVGSPPALPLGEQIYACDHDLIVSHLAALLLRWKYKIGNDVNSELFLMQPGSDKISHVLAVSTDSQERNVFAAAAKLLLRKASDDHPSAFLIMPEEKLPLYVQPMQRINIVAIGFRLEGERIIFPDLGKIRLDQNTQL